MIKNLFKLLVLFIYVSVYIFSLSACGYEEYDNVEVCHTINEIKNAFEYASKQPESMNTAQLKDMDKIRKILGNGITRHISETISYSVYNCINGGKLFIFYDDKTADYDMILDVYFFMKKLRYDTFNSIKPGVSTLDDIKKIDPASNITYINYTDEKYTTHFTEDGIIKINYNIIYGKEIVKSINLEYDDLSNQILQDDLV